MRTVSKPSEYKRVALVPFESKHSQLFTDQEQIRCFCCCWFIVVERLSSLLEFYFSEHKEGQVGENLTTDQNKVLNLYRSLADKLMTGWWWGFFFWIALFDTKRWKLKLLNLPLLKVKTVGWKASHRRGNGSSEFNGNVFFLCVCWYRFLQLLCISICIP